MSARQNFGSIIVCDFEYEVAPGDLPNPLCMVAHVLDENLRHVRAVRLWRGEFGPAPPFDVGPDALFVAYSAWAELTCFQVLGWKFPTHVFDCHTAYLAASNVLLEYAPDEPRRKRSNKLPDACKAYGIKGWEHIDKPHIAEAIGNGTWRGKYSPQEIVDYCGEDVGKTAELLRAQVRPGRNFLLVNVDRVLHWSDYSVKCVAPHSGARHANRHGAVEPRAGEQASGDRGAAPRIRSFLWQRRSDLQRRGRMELRAVRALVNQRRH
jgi:hypothetical protein